MEYSRLIDEFEKVVFEDFEIIHNMMEHEKVDKTDGIHIFFGMIVVPYVISLIQKNEKNKLQEVFCFFEKMARSLDAMICEVLEFTILEGLAAYGKEVWEKSKMFMLEETYDSCLAIEKYIDFDNR